MHTVLRGRATCVGTRDVLGSMYSRSAKTSSYKTVVKSLDVGPRPGSGVRLCRLRVVGAKSRTIRAARDFLCCIMACRLLAVRAGMVKIAESYVKIARVGPV
jgi:hypothetical protein